MAQVHTYSSSDSGAPAFGDAASEMITWLDAILVNGYNSKTITITRSSTTATATCVTHGFRTGQILAISGANETDYNGNFRITVTDADTFTYTVANSPATPATGTITAKVAPAGWTKPYTGTNIAVYRAPAGTNQRYYRFDDTNALYARLVGYESMSGASTGTGPFPTAAQLSGGLYFHKTSSGGTSRDWYATYCVDTGWMNVIVSVDGNADWTGAHYSGFGAIKSAKSGDAYNDMAFAGAATSGTTSFYCGNYTSGGKTVIPGHYLARAYTGLGGAVNVAKFIDNYLAGVTNSNVLIGNTGIAFPNKADGGLYLSNIRVYEPTADAMRGTVPGVWAPMHARPLQNLEEVPGTGDYSGKTFKAFNLAGSAQILLEISDTVG